MLRFAYRMKHRKMAKASGRLPDGTGTGQLGRITKLRKLVTALIRHERIEGRAGFLDETRGYAELVCISLLNSKCLVPIFARKSRGGCGPPGGGGEHHQIIGVQSEMKNVPYYCQNISNLKQSHFIITHLS